MSISSDSSSTTGSSETTDHGKQPPEEHRQSVDELASRLVQTETVSEDTAMFIARNWQRFASFAIICLIIVWLVGEFRTADENKTGEAAVKFSEVQEQFNTLFLKGDPKDVPADSRRAFTDTLDVIQKSYGDSVYSEFAPLYSAAAAFQGGELEQAKKQLETLNVNRFNEFKSPADLQLPNANSLAAELGAMLYAKVLIEQQPEATLSSSELDPIRERLRGIAYGAQVVNVEALLTLLRLAETTEQVSAANTIAVKLIEKRPGLADIISREFGNLSQSLTL